MSEKQRKFTEDDFIDFLIDPDSFSEREKDQLRAAFHKDLSTWEQLTGTPPALTLSRYHRIRAAFWERTAGSRCLSRKICLTTSGIVAAVVLYFVFTAGIIPHTNMTATVEVPPIIEEYSSSQYFEDFTDSILPVEPLPDTNWFSFGSDLEADETLLEDLLTLTTPEGELS